MAGEAFFHSSDTHREIQDISQWTNLTLYLGAGAAVDRTGLGWKDMISELLRYVVPDDALRKALVEQYDPARAASIASDLFEVTYGPPAYQAVLRGRLRELLYGPREAMAGQLLDACGTLAVDFFLQGRSVCVVTTNYDVFIREQLQLELLKVGVDGSWLREFHAGECSQDELLDSLSEPGITLLYLHGLVTRDGTNDRDPVLSELDYHRVAEMTGSMLRVAISGRNLFMVGSSLTDPPLLDALHETLKDPLIADVLSPENEATDGSSEAIEGENHTPVAATNETAEPDHSEDGSADLDHDEVETPDPEGTDDEEAATEEDEIRPQRTAIMPLQGSEWSIATPATIEGLMDLGRNRAHHFGVRVVYADYFFQIGQFVNEISVALADDETPYDEYVCDRRYGSRLVDWWEVWLYKTKASEEAQRKHHGELVKYLEDVRVLLGAPPSEALRLEVWVRWHPERERTLCLWASSVGTWRDPESMRRDSIADNSHFRSVRVFCIGSPTFFEADDSDETRWRTYLGVPIWFGAFEGVLQAGVVTMASTRGPKNSSLTARNTRRVGSALQLLTTAGKFVVSGGERRYARPSPKGA